MADPLTLAAGTAEQQIFEVCTRAAKTITDYKSANPAANIKGISIRQTLDLVNQRATFSITLPITQAYSPDGGIEFDADPVLA